ncbi:MAG: hypothetical protein KF774_21200 [Planctomyces sp.]|nr:hypothetical protein [Planctomyces sp.]
MEVRLLVRGAVVVVLVVSIARQGLRRLRSADFKADSDAEPRHLPDEAPEPQ